MARRGGIGRRRGQGRRLRRLSGEAFAKLSPRKPTETLADYIPRLASVPLDFQPGTQWAYSPAAGIDVLGRVVEVVSDLTFDQFLRQRNAGLQPSTIRFPLENPRFPR
ncbi:MAG: hypothetical protein DMF89_08560 [Acidobacteria bacterium]|nr:MAG: hypothetical protein DMF98_06465 [Acidobacteriota bacterium]PYR50611.1 MAG: hypothetical protein DMF89_08560 [Acidobacteriota bacterium]